jgi:hypothetical protein
VSATWLLAGSTVVAGIGGMISYSSRHTGPQGSWPPALHVLIPICTIGWFSSVTSFFVRRRQYALARFADTTSAEPAAERQPLAVPNRLMLS